MKLWKLVEMKHDYGKEPEMMCLLDEWMKIVRRAMGRRVVGSVIVCHGQWRLL